MLTGALIFVTYVAVTVISLLLAVRFVRAMESSAKSMERLAEAWDRWTSPRRPSL